MAHNRWTLSRVFVLAVVTAHVALVMFPFVWMTYSAFKTNQEFMQSVWSLPHSLHWANFTSAWGDGAMGQYAVNSLVITLSTVAITVLAATGAGYASAVYRIRWLPKVELGLVLAMAIPAYVALVPLVGTLRAAGLLDSRLGVILPTVAFNVPVTVFIMRAFFATLPRELIEAARMDGASELRIFARIAIPLARPSMFTAAIVNMVWVWNDFLFPLVFLSSPEKKTLPVGLTDFVGEHVTNYPVLLAAILIAAIGPLALYTIFQRQVIGGLIGGAVKG